jgi:hypothetical protein
MEHAENGHLLDGDAISNDIRCAPDHELARPFHPAGSAAARVRGETPNLHDDGVVDGIGRRWIVLGDVRNDVV